MLKKRLSCEIMALMGSYEFIAITMQEKEFRKLLDKYLNGSISEEEENLLNKFKEELKLNAEPNFQNETEKHNIEKSLWTGINVQKSANSKNRKPVNWKITAAAAVFIGIIATAYIFMQNLGLNTPISIPENAITLQLEDGSIKIIEEDQTAKVLDKNGNLLGQQKGNQLVYKETSAVEKLVYNTLTVPYGKNFELQLSDGTTAHLNAGSSLKYPVKFLKGEERQIFITGEAYLNVAKDSLHPFIVNTGELSVRVLGTQFNVSAYPEDDATDIVLVEGSVSLFTKADGYDIDKNTLLKPGIKGSFDREKNSITTKAVITSIYTSWMDGELIFRNMSFENILKKLERHYDVVIVNNNKDLSQKYFNANFGSEPIGNVLEELKMNYGVDYVVSGDEIIIN